MQLTEGQFEAISYAIGTLAATQIDNATLHRRIRALKSLLAAHNAGAQEEPVGYILPSDLKELARGNGAVVSPRTGLATVPLYAQPQPMQDVARTDEQQDQNVVWTATSDGSVCRAAFERGRSFGMGVAFNQTTEHYHRDNGIGHFDAYHDGEWQAWRKAWQAARAAQPMMTDAARDAEDAKRYRFIKSKMQVGAVQTQLPLYRTLHWIGYEDCSDVRDADAAIDAEIERGEREGEHETR